MIRQEIEMKGIQIGKEEVKLSLFGDNMIVCIENLSVSTKKLDLIMNLEKQWDTVNTQKSKASFYTNNKISETEIRKNIPFAITADK